MHASAWPTSSPAPSSARSSRRSSARATPMPSASPADVRTAIAKGTLGPLYLLLGDDDAEISRLAADITSVVEDELRAFNVERIYAGEKGSTAASVVEAAQMLPMMSDRRVVVVVRAERLLKPKRRGKAAIEEP